MLNTDKIRSDFKLLSGKGSPVYFDSACMSLKPNCVVDAMNEYYYEFPACTNRSPHKMGQKATKKVEEARKNIAKFINANSDKEIINSAKQKNKRDLKIAIEEWLINNLKH